MYPSSLSYEDVSSMIYKASYTSQMKVRLLYEASAQPAAHEITYTDASCGEECIRPHNHTYNTPIAPLYEGNATQSRALYG